MCHYLGGHVQIFLYNNVINQKGLLLLGTFKTSSSRLFGFPSAFYCFSPTELKLTILNFVYMSAECNPSKSFDWP